ncbi:MAG: hypothetical protein RID53_27250, partial [Coleofasciculus sp. B1-GNL1-01]|uniref:hypothetical protein n=1 Tax=Coleofasciculus sp. B1-GNL1-01 TaxID=3068484 RepID=UPI0033013D57
NREWAMGNGQWFHPSVEGKFGAVVGEKFRIQEGGSIKTLHLLGRKMDGNPYLVYLTHQGKLI